MYTNLCTFSENQLQLFLGAKARRIIRRLSSGEIVQQVYPTMYQRILRRLDALQMHWCTVYGSVQCSLEAGLGFPRRVKDVEWRWKRKMKTEGEFMVKLSTRVHWCTLALKHLQHSKRICTCTNNYLCFGIPLMYYGKHCENRKKLPREHLIGCQGVKMFLLKDHFKVDFVKNWDLS